MIHEVGALVDFLPYYNPIESMFSKLKAEIKAIEYQYVSSTDVETLTLAKQVGVCGVLVHAEPDDSLWRELALGERALANAVAASTVAVVINSCFSCLGRGASMIMGTRGGSSLSWPWYVDVVEAEDRSMHHRPDFFFACLLFVIPGVSLGDFHLVPCKSLSLSLPSHQRKTSLTRGNLSYIVVKSPLTDVLFGGAAFKMPSITFGVPPDTS